MQNQLLYKIALAHIKGVGPKLCRNIIAYLGSVEAVFSESSQALSKIPGVGIKTAEAITDPNVMHLAQKELDFIVNKDITTSFYLDSNYPSRLKQCEDAPIILYSKGNHNLSDNKVISIVGTRKVTEYGKENCVKLIKEISEQFSNVTIVSGLAYGVDICAHRAALEFGLPTIAVMAHGLDRIYPSVHKKTATDILSTGALLTEFTSGTNPDRQNFVKRNRIVAGIADATIVIESASKGGALITAGIAQSYNRDVLAYPGRVGDEFSMGCNHLIKSNVAAMIEGAKDLAYALNWEVDYENNKQLSMFNAPVGEEGLIYELLLSNKEMSINALSAQTSITVSKLASLLLKMEFDGLVKNLPGNLYRCLQ
ncbi:DNA-processing protein DprA [Saccharicrinis aurantiacus]|uniref:DNA-processing protein DprA n=1 Tax=Saccharicrinis aurantiacus TaxID=1849719 RepID=UPI00094F9764|nr:DNA-processing protein DprA [Saccharicrinis aurantiacus]